MNWQCKDLLQNLYLKIAFTYIDASFSQIASSIEKFETLGLAMAMVVERISKIEQTLEKLCHQRFYDKLVCVLSKNIEYPWIKDVKAM